MTDLIIFDLDGTLLDTIEDLGDSVNEVLAAHGFPGHSYSDYCYFIGDGADLLVRRSLPEGTDEAVVATVLEQYREAYARNWNRNSRPYDGVVGLLSALEERAVRMAVLSNKPDDFTNLCVSTLLPAGFIEKAYGQRPGVPRKPDPGAAVAIAEEMGVRVERTMFVGDTNVDMKTATGAGMVPVGVLWGFREEAELCEAGAAHTVAKPEEILALL